MNHRGLKDQELHGKLVHLVKEEKKLIVQILHLLREVEARRLFSDFKCRSLFDYATKILGYSESEAYMRISAMKLLKELPAIEKDIQSGEISLTNVAQAQSFFRKAKQNPRLLTDQVAKASRAIEEVGEEEAGELGEFARTARVRESLGGDPDLAESSQLKHNDSSGGPGKTRFDEGNGSTEEINCQSQQTTVEEQKLAILKSLKNKSTREVKTLLSLPENENGTQETDQVKYLANGNVELRTEMTLEAYQKLVQLKESFQKNHGLQNNCDDVTLANLVELLHQSRFRKKSTCAHKKPSVNNRTLTPAMKIHIQTRDGHKCVNCGSSKSLEIDHIRPQALGGSHHPENLQTLCRSCNQRRAVKTFGDQSRQYF